ncbi:MAG: hypothetical protein J6M43_00400 [Neisseriaceae bacterium]|nr:hypothetical protein [Neisseriaceae bacterium]
MLNKEEQNLIEYFEKTLSCQSDTECNVLYRDNDNGLFIKQKKEEKKNNIEEISLRNPVYNTEKGEIKFLYYLINKTDYCSDLFRIYEFESFNFNGDGYYKLVMRCENHKHNFNFFENDSYRINFSVKENENIDKNLQLYISVKRDFIYVKNIDKLNFDKFNDYATNALLAYGFINGELSILGKGYYFEYDNIENLKNGKFCGFRYSENMVSCYKNSLKLYHGNPKITENAFEKMINTMINNHLFFNAIFSILVSNKIPKGIESACLYATVLESLTEFFQEQDKKDKQDENLDDKDLIDSIKKEFKDIFNKHQKEFKNKDTRDTILNNINNNILRISNSKKLVKPFENLNIILTEEDKKIIKKRNPLLHGSFKYKSDEFKKQIDENLCLNLSLDLFCNALIYKYLFGRDTKIELKNDTYKIYREF